MGQTKRIQDFSWTSRIGDGTNLIFIDLHSFKKGEVGLGRQGEEKLLSPPQCCIYLECIVTLGLILTEKNKPDSILDLSLQF